MPVVVNVIGRFVKLDAFPDAGVPSAGVTSVGLVANTTLPLPVLLTSPIGLTLLDGVPAVKNCVPDGAVAGGCRK